MKKLLFGALVGALSMNGFAAETEKPKGNGEIVIAKCFNEAGDSSLHLVSLNEDLKTNVGGLNSETNVQYELGEKDVDYAGIFWYVHDTIQQPGFFIDSLTKTDSGMYFQVTQVQGAFQPFGFVFGDDNGVAPGGNPYGLNMMDDDIHMRFKVKNLGDSTIQVRIALQDTNGNLLNTFKYNVDGDVEYNLVPIYAGDFRVDLIPGQEAYIEDGLKEGYFQMKGGYHKYWSQIDSTHKCRPCHDILNDFDGDDKKFVNENFYKTGLASFDYTAVKGVNITVANVKHNGTRDINYNPVAANSPSFNEYTSYQPLALKNYPVLITELSINKGDKISAYKAEGYTCPVGGVGISEKAAEYSFVVSPNPVSDLLTVTYDVNGSSDVRLEVINNAGYVVSSTAGTSVDVSTLAAGSYHAVLVIDGVRTASSQFVKK